ncbi:MAG: amino acid permease [Gammaproteobacteria bacterium]|nr:amino acid permease [Gammaproteobacteria bacterium]
MAHGHNPLVHARHRLDERVILESGPGAPLPESKPTPLDPTLALKRSITLYDGIMFVISLMIGSGIFLKPQAVLVDSGSSGMALLMWILGGVITMCCGLTIAEIAACMPKLGGLYAYLSDLYGAPFGFLYGWVEAIISSPASCAALAIAASTFASFFVPMNDVQQKALGVLMIVLIVAINAIATKGGVWLQNIATILKLTPIFAIIGFGLAHGTFGTMNPASVGAAPMRDGVALLGVLWAYDGWINITALGAEIVEPERNLPLAIVFGIATVILIYVLFNLAVYCVLPLDRIAASRAVGRDLSEALFGHWGGAFITAGMLVSVFGALNSQLMSGTRVSMAVGQRRELPGWRSLSAVNRVSGTPVYSLLIQGVIAIVFLLFGSFNSLSNLVIFVIWIFFTLGVMGIFVLRRRTARIAGRYAVPLYPIVPLAGIAGGWTLMIATFAEAPKNALLGIGLTLSGLPCYYGAKRRQSADVGR